jgi:hypothetical protein
MCKSRGVAGQRDRRIHSFERTRPSVNLPEVPVSRVLVRLAPSSPLNLVHRVHRRYRRPAVVPPPLTLPPPSSPTPLGGSVHTTSMGVPFADQSLHYNRVGIGHEKATANIFLMF